MLEKVQWNTTQNRNSYLKTQAKPICSDLMRQLSDVTQQ